ncbi:MAG: cell envelope integrity protein CreD, partial [Azonexus sp.]
FSAPPPNSDAELLDLQATLVVGLSDPRGITSDPEVTINGQRRRFAGGKVDPEIMPVQPLTVALGPIEAGKAHDFSVAFPLRLTGTTRLSVAPVGESNRIALQSAWPHPNFGGRFLPRERSVGADGFKARWEVSHLARNFTNALNPGSGEALSIDFIDPVNVYLQAERAVKYGVLFIVLTFAGFFLIETLRRAPIHPLQYLLVGLALAIFFLLLIALSEHMPFAAAYGASAAACIGLISAYLSGVFGGWRRGAAFGSGLTGLYGVLFGVLRSEDNALLMGSLLLFTALGAVMLATRRLDWYKLDGKAESV